jgi:hypothetical protein
VLKLGTSINAAFKMALETWASWVKESVNLSRTRVFFRTYEPSHWRCVSLILDFFGIVSHCQSACSSTEYMRSLHPLNVIIIEAIKKVVSHCPHIFM